MHPVEIQDGQNQDAWPRKLRWISKERLLSFSFLFSTAAPTALEVPRLRVKSELQLLAYTRATSAINAYDLCLSLWQCRIFDSLSKARDQTRIFVDIMSGSEPAEPQQELPKEWLWWAHSVFLTFKNWSMVDLQCWISFWYTAKRFNYTYLYSLSDSFPLWFFTWYWL